MKSQKTAWPKLKFRSVVVLLSVSAVASSAFAEGPVGPDVFQKLLLERQKQDAGASLDVLAQKIAEEEATSRIGGSAIAYLATNARWTPELAHWMKSFADRHPQDASGGSAFGIWLAHESPRNAAQLALTCVRENPGTETGWTACQYLFRVYTDSVDTETIGTLRSLLTWSLGNWAPERFRDTASRETLFISLDALGKPYLSARLAQAVDNERPWKAQLSSVRSLILAEQNTPSGSVGDPGQSIRAALDRLFMADFRCSEEDFQSASDELLNAPKAGNGNEARAWMTCLPDFVAGLCRRSQRPQSFFSSMRRGGEVDPNSLLQPWLEQARLLNQNDRTPSAEQDDLLLQSARQFRGAGLLTAAEACYSAAMECAGNAEYLEEVGLEFAKFYRDDCNAGAPACQVLRDLLARGGSEKARFLLAQALYSKKSYEEVVDLLSVYTSGENASPQRPNALFVLGAALGQLGRYDEMGELLRQSRAETKDPKLVAEIDRILVIHGQAQE